MIALEILDSDSPQFLGTWTYEWNTIVIGGPKGLSFSTTTHVPIKVSIYQKKYLMWESSHFNSQCLVQGKKVTFPFVVRPGEEMQCKYFRCKVISFKESNFPSLEDGYKEESIKLQRDDLATRIIQTLLED